MVYLCEDCTHCLTDRLTEEGTVKCSCRSKLEEDEFAADNFDTRKRKTGQGHYVLLAQTSCAFYEPVTEVLTPSKCKNCERFIESLPGSVTRCALKGATANIYMNDNIGCAYFLSKGRLAKEIAPVHWQQYKEVKQ